MKWTNSLRELEQGAEVVYAMFSNNGRSPESEVPRDLRVRRGEVTQAPTNAAMLEALLG